MREIVFDTETTGISPHDGHRMVEIGCVELINKCETGRTFQAYFNPGRPMPSEAEAVHGLSATFLSDKKAFTEHALELLEFLEDCPLVAHNASFDFGFLNHELKYGGHPPVCLTRMVDTVAIARARHPGAKHSLDALCSRYGIDRSHRVKHGALLDAQLLAQLYVELSGGRQIGFAMVPEPAQPLFGMSSTAGTISRPVRPPRPHFASDAELATHAAFIAGLVNPLWSDAARAG